MSGEVDKKKVPLALAALGVVFGDIGTSPLYAYQTALWELKHLDRAGVLGIASLIIWSLIIIVTFRYVFIVMRADYRGEGGVFALLAKLNEKLGKPHGFKLPLYALLLLFGAALLFGDGTITPAISVLSAMEGLEAIHPSLEAYIIPGTVGDSRSSLFGAAIRHGPAGNDLWLGDAALVPRHRDHGGYSGS